MWDVAIFGGVENAEMENVGPLDFDYCCMRYTCIQFTSVLFVRHFHYCIFPSV